MVSREHKRVVFHEKLQLLRSVTNSHALNKTSIIVDACKYIQELKQKVERLNEEIAAEEDNSTPMVTVETLEKGFLISVYSEKGCPGLLVCVLEVFEELGLNVMEARASCTDTFRLEAVGGENQNESVDAQVVKQAVLQAIKNCTESSSTNGGGSPTAGCCTALGSLISSSTDCACLILTGSVPFNLPINRQLAITLPRSCNNKTVPIQCKASATPLPSPGPVASAPSLPPLPPFGSNSEPPAVPPSVSDLPASPPENEGVNQTQRPLLQLPNSAVKLSIFSSPTFLLVLVLGAILLN